MARRRSAPPMSFVNEVVNAAQPRRAKRTGIVRRRLLIFAAGLVLTFGACWAVAHFFPTVPNAMLAAVFAFGGTATVVLTLAGTGQRACTAALVIGVAVATIAMVGEVKNATVTGLEVGSEGGSHGVGAVKAWIESL